MNIGWRFGSLFLIIIFMRGIDLDPGNVVPKGPVRSIHVTVRGDGDRLILALPAKSINIYALDRTAVNDGPIGRDIPDDLQFGIRDSAGFFVRLRNSNFHTGHRIISVPVFLIGRLPIRASVIGSALRRGGCAVVGAYISLHGKG